MMKTNPENMMVMFGIAAITMLVICYLSKSEDQNKVIEASS